LDQLSGPSWHPSHSDTAVAESSAFDACKSFLDAVSSEKRDEVTERGFSHSRRWGYVPRAKIVTTIDGSHFTTLFTCWGDQTTGVQVSEDVPLTSDCPNEPG
jgi:hypothetical protein